MQLYRKHQCPLNEKCLTNNVSYKASITKTKKIRKQKFILALVKQHLSSDMRTIKKTFNNIKYQTDTELSNEYWNIISANKTSWEILGTHKPYNQSSKRCFLFSKKSWQSLCTGTITCYKQIIRSDKQVQVQQQIYASQYDMKD